MGKDSKPNGQSTEKYGEVVQRLEDVVKRLEGGDLTLEDSLKAFEEGIGLVRRGEKLLTEAEVRIEQLLAGEGEARTAPLDPATPTAAPRAVKGAPAAVDDDIPF